MILLIDLDLHGKLRFSGGKNLDSSPSNKVLNRLSLLSWVDRETESERYYAQRKYWIQIGIS